MSERCRADVRKANFDTAASVVCLSGPDRFLHLGNLWDGVESLVKSHRIRVPRVDVTCSQALGRTWGSFASRTATGGSALPWRTATWGSVGVGLAGTWGSVRARRRVRAPAATIDLKVCLKVAR